MRDNSLYLKALIEGDRVVIKTIYSNTLPRVIKFVCQNKGSEDDAKEVFQNALLQLVVRYKKDQFVITGSFEAYLFTVCKNMWRRELKRRKIEVTSNSFLELRDKDEDIVYAILEQKQWEIFNDAINKLSDNCKRIMDLFFSRIPYAEMLKILNYTSENVIRQRVFKCKAKLKSLIIEDHRFNQLKGL